MPLQTDRKHSLDRPWLPGSLSAHRSPQAAASVEDHPPKLSQSRITEPGPPRARSILSITRIRPGTPSQERPTTPPASPKPHKSSGRCKCCRCCQKRKAKSISYSALPAAPEPPYPVAPAHSLPSLPRTHGLSEERVIAVTFPERSVSLFADLSELDARPPPKPARSLARKPAFSRRAVVETLSVHPSELGSAILADYAKPSLRRRAKSSTSLSSRLGRPPSVKASRSQPTLRVTYLASSDDELHTEAPSLPETPFLAKVIPEPGNAAQEASRTPMEATPGPSVTQDGNQKMSTVTDAGVSLLPSERDALLSPEISPRNPFMHVSTLPSTSSRPRSHTPKMVQPRTKLLQRHVQRDDTRPPPVVSPFSLSSFKPLDSHAAKRFLPFFASANDLSYYKTSF